VRGPKLRLSVLSRAIGGLLSLSLLAGELGDDGIPMLYPLSYMADAMAGLEPATCGLEVTVVFTTGETSSLERFLRSPPRLRSIRW